MFEAIESAADGSVSLTLVRGIEERTVEVTPTA
jgi:hypothetical protein